MNVAAILTDSAGAELGTVANPINVTGVNVEVDLDAADDSVSSWTKDGTGTAITSTGGALDVNIASLDTSTTDSALANVAIISTAKTLTVAGTAETAVTSALTDRKYLFVYNNYYY